MIFKKSLRNNSYYLEVDELLSICTNWPPVSGFRLRTENRHDANIIDIISIGGC